MRTRNEVYTKYNYTAPELAAALSIDKAYTDYYAVAFNERRDLRDTIPDAPVYVRGLDRFFAGLYAEKDVTVVACANQWEADKVIEFIKEHDPQVRYLRTTVIKPTKERKTRFANCPNYRFRALEITSNAHDDPDLYNPDTQPEHYRIPERK